jgi:outer membrane protein assembly factor BamB
MLLGGILFLLLPQINRALGFALPYLLAVLRLGSSSAAASETSKRPPEPAPRERPPRELWCFGQSKYYNSVSDPVVLPDGALVVSEGESVVALEPSGVVRWRWEATDPPKDPRTTRPVLVADGIAVGMRGRVVVLNREGVLRFVKTLADPHFVVSSLVASADGALYFVDSPGSIIRAVGSRGQDRWSVDMGGHAVKSPYVDATGRLFFACGGKLFAHEADGRRAWSAGTVGTDVFTVFGDTHGAIYMTGNNHTLAVSADGAILWTTGATPSKDTACAYAGMRQDEQRNLYFGCRNRALSLDASGRVRWETRLQSASNVMTRPVFRPDGAFYLGGGELATLRPDGTLLWSFTPRMPSEHSDDVRITADPYVSSDGTVFFGCDRDRVYALSSTGNLRWIYKLGSDDTSIIPVTTVMGLKDMILVRGSRLVALPYPGEPGRVPEPPAGRS